MIAPVMNNVLIAASTGAAISLLALAMPRHHETVFGTPPAKARAELLRFSGWLALAASLLVALATWDGGASLVAWFALLSAHGTAAGLLLAYAPRALPAWLGVWSATVAVIVAAGLIG